MTYLEVKGKVRGAWWTYDGDIPEIRMGIVLGGGVGSLYQIIERHCNDLRSSKR
jgi:hypothetical protein